MKYKTLGKSGLLVSEYCLGTPGFVSDDGGEKTLQASASENVASDILHAALDKGVNFIDTADYYGLGQSEEIIGRVLGSLRQEVVIASKVGLRVGSSLMDAGLSRRHILASVDGSLRRLGSDWIDVYIVHRTDPFTPLEETLAALDDVVRAGKVRYIGYSNWPAWLAAKAIGLQRENGWARFIVAQMYYSLAGRELEFDTIPFALDAGIGIMAWSPLANGFLTGKYTRGDPSGGGGRLAHFTLGPFDVERGHAVVDVLREIASRHSTTPAQIAFAWLTRQAGVATILLGVSRLDQLQSNLTGAQIELTAEDLGALDFVSQIPEPYPNWYNSLMADDAAVQAFSGRHDPGKVRVGADAYPRFYRRRDSSN